MKDPGKSKSRFNFHTSTELAVKIVFFAAIIFALFILIHYSRADRMEPIVMDPVEFIEEWTVDDGNGNVFTTGRRYNAEKRYDKQFTITSYLPSDVKDNTFLCFQTGMDIRVYIGGELRRDYYEERDYAIPGENVKRFYLLIPLTEEDAGAEVRMERSPTIKNGQIVPETFVSTLGGIYALMMERYGLTFMLAEVVMIFSLVVIVVSVTMRFLYRHRIDMLYGALGIFVIAAWVMTNSFLYTFVFGHYHVDGIVNYLLCLMIPFGPLIYLNSVQHGRYRKSMTALMIISVVNCIFWSLLHFTRVYTFNDSLVYINIIMGLEALAAIALLIVDAVRGYTSEYRYTAIGFAGFLACSLIEIMYLLFLAPKYDELPMVAGLTFFLVFVVIQQVEDLRKAQAEKQRAIDLSEAKTKFLASMSHEIRTPINSILGMNEMILRENRDQVVNDYARSIKSSGKMLLMLVNDVLDFSRIEAGKLEITNGEFHLSDLLNDVLSMIGERAQEKDLELKTEMEGQIPDAIISDEFRIRQILINILSNGVKYTDEGSVTLSIGGEYEEENTFLLRFTIKDTGRGIRKEDQEHLFEAFSRADIRKNVSIEGTGLGLSIVKSILDSMNGSISVESAYGVGSAFRIALPVDVADKTPMDRRFMDRKPDTGNVEEVSEYHAPDARVLAVDDNQSNLTIVRLFLRQVDIEPDLCNSGQQAIDLCKKNKYDLILLDHMMPSPDGVETLHIIREDPDSLNRDTNAIVLTANAVAGSRQLYMDAGFADYLTKPIDNKLLEQTVRRFLPEDKIMTEKKEPAENPSEEKTVSPLRAKAETIEGLDYDDALFHCGGDESILQEVFEEIVVESTDRCIRMRNALKEKDLPTYRIEAHSIKSVMATVGLSALSERAKKNEFAARDGDLAFIESDAESFIDEYEDICQKIVSDVL